MLHYVHLHTHAQQRAVPAGVGLAGDFLVISKLGRHPYPSKLGLKSCIFELLSMCWFQRTKNH